MEEGECAALLAKRIGGKRLPYRRTNEIPRTFKQKARWFLDWRNVIDLAEMTPAMTRFQWLI